ncbi:signal recognition particle subunit srp68 [Coemansia nantahalensis]|uniref:Signal recognition particle subunit srp68 n=1 Tax=Coemansia nantahalensis TaxID=2789366 RepID=A0ACC1JSY6_9FUNG|nr:signal recognition particle subunit srp68 [Coemansia nantahalensis]
MAAVASDVFGFICDSRRAHGAGAQDFLQYRRSCGHGLHAARKAAGLAQGTSGGYRRRDVAAEAAGGAAHVEILLLQAERAWAYAMDLRELYACTEEPRQRQHLVRRLRAACKAARQLAALVPGFCDTRTVLAAHAYWLQLQAQLHFELEEWAAALDCASAAYVASDQLALTGGPRQSALPSSIVETLDPVIRLAAHQARVAGAHSALPAAVAAQWYEAHVKEADGRAAESEPGLGDTVAALERLLEEAGAGGATHAHSLQWRGAAVGYSDPELAALVEEAQRLLGSAGEGDAAALDCAAAAFRRVQRQARLRQPEQGRAPVPAHVVLQLFSAQALAAIAMAKLTGEARTIAAAHSAWPAVGPWIADDASGRPAGARTGLPERTQLVACYDRARKSVAALQAAVADALAALPPPVSREIGAQRLADEAAAAAAHYRCVRNFHSAALHASSRHGRYQDALALLDTVVTADAPHAAALAAALADPPAGSPADALWARQLAVAAADVDVVGAAAEAALPIAQGLCAATAQDAKTAQAPAAWLHAPDRPPATVANGLAAGPRRAARQRPAWVPRLVDAAAPAFAPVPVKPLFYDLAAAAIDFDMAAIDARAGAAQPGAAQPGGSSGLGKLIGSLWAR